MAENLNTSPSVSGVMIEMPGYRLLGSGLTDRLFLLGHADGLSLNDPYQVLNIQEAVNKLAADTSSPLLRGLLEAYYAGARDIWLVAVAPMSEYEADVSARNTNKVAYGNITFYQKYYSRLTASYALLNDWDMPQIVVPVEASFYNATGADFLTQLATHCSNSFSTTGSVRLGFLGTRGTIDATAVAVMLADTRIAAIPTTGKFVSVCVGDGAVNFKELTTASDSSVAVTAAAELSSLPLDRGLTYQPLANIIAPTSGDLTKAQVKQLCEKKLNPLIRTTRGRRGASFQSVLASDNTCGTTGSDFWSLVQMRLVTQVVENIRSLANRHLGTIGFGQFKHEVEAYMISLTFKNVIRSYSLSISRDEVDRYKALVDVTVQPYFGLRTITFNVAVGPES